jgi:hypothetical protein
MKNIASFILATIAMHSDLLSVIGICSFLILVLNFKEFYSLINYKQHEKFR